MNRFIEISTGKVVSAWRYTGDNAKKIMESIGNCPGSYYEALTVNGVFLVFSTALSPSKILEVNDWLVSSEGMLTCYGLGFKNLYRKADAPELVRLKCELKSMQKNLGIWKRRVTEMQALVNNYDNEKGE